MNAKQDGGNTGSPVTPTVEAICAVLGGTLRPFESKQRLSTLCTFLADDDRLVVVAHGKVKQKDADLALAWALAYRGDRSLTVILPAGRSEPTRIRVPWLVPAVRVLTYDDARLLEPLPLTKSESLASFADRTWDVGRPAALGEKAGWVHSLLAWTKVAPQLERVERSSYVAWHVAGRQVLKVVPTRAGLKVTAGVQSTKPEDWPEPVQVEVTGPLADDEVHRLVAAASSAASARLAGVDAGHREHRMQAALDPAQLGLATGWIREFPAWRPGYDRAAFIDFLAKDPSGRPHVVETKIAADAMLVLQGLDYWVWCRANAEFACAALDASSDRTPVIDFVVAPAKPDGEPISIYTAAQAEALDRNIAWRFVVVDDPDTAQHVQPLPPYRLPENHRRANSIAPRWAVRLHEHATNAARDAGRSLVRTHSYRTPAEALVPGALDAYQRLDQLGLLHSHVLHVRSSQAFALNMLAPLSLDAWAAIARYHLNDPSAAVVASSEFEYVDPDDELAEATKASPHTTQVDCLVRVNLRGGRTHALLIEVKLSEDTFSTCSAFSSDRNDRRHICGQPGPFGGDPAGCFQSANHDREHRRRYDIALDGPDGDRNSLGCWFRDGANQVMRNAALAKVLTARGEVDGASVILMAPDGHDAIWEQWRRHTGLLSAYDGVRFAELPASQVAALHGADEARWLSERYMLPSDILETRLAQRLVDERFPDGVGLVRLENGGSVRYMQGLGRIAVEAVASDEIVISTPYPAGPVVHRTSRADWAPHHAEVVIREPDGDGSRVLTANPSRFERDLTDGNPLAIAWLRDEAPEVAHRSILEQPWWTAPLSLESPWW